jgi:hypothetical protein
LFRQLDDHSPVNTPGVPKWRNRALLIHDNNRRARKTSTTVLRGGEGKIFSGPEEYHAAYGRFLPRTMMGFEEG